MLDMEDSNLKVVTEDAPVQNEDALQADVQAETPDREPMFFTVELQEQAIQLILQSLNELPHKVSRGTIDAIVMQVQKQLAAAQMGGSPEQEG